MYTFKNKADLNRGKIFRMFKIEGYSMEQISVDLQIDLMEIIRVIKKMEKSQPK